MKKKLVLYILPFLLIAGCATTREPEPTMPKTTPLVERNIDKQTSVVIQPAEPYVPPTPQQAEAEPGKRQAEPSVVSKTVLPEPKVVSTPLQKTGVSVADGHTGVARLAETNENKLLNVYKGMDKATVELIMAAAHNPYKREKIAGAAGQIYEVLFYLTREPRKNKPITNRQLTPVIFRNGEVVGMNNSQLKKLRNTGTLGREKRTSSRPK